ncbi:MAG: hypothetical protein FWE54_04390 [Methanimicrococcus sp.]|nr:hypothetical protein [Methanimicrococcus sp.]
MEINQQQQQQIMIIAVHSDSVLRCAQTGIRNERSVYGIKREEKNETPIHSFYSKPERRFFKTLKDKFKEKGRSLFLFS